MTSPILVVLFAAAWIGLGLLAWMYIGTRPSAADKRRAHRAIVVGVALVFAAVAIVTMPTSAAIVIPAVALIAWGNLRHTHFCEACGKMSLSQPLQRLDLCPRCGAAMPQHGSPASQP